MRKVTPEESEQIRSLELRLGSLRFRTLMTPESNRLMRPERLGNLSGGSGRITDEEAARIKAIRRNSNKLISMGKRKTPSERKGGKRREYEVNRKQRDWLFKGKDKGTSLKQWQTDNPGWYDALATLDYFDIDPDEKTYYVDKE